MSGKDIDKVIFASHNALVVHYFILSLLIGALREVKITLSISVSNMLDVSM